MPYITLETYPPMDRENYDNELLLFTVPYSWLSEKYDKDPLGTFDLDYFLTDEYGWDDTLTLYDHAYYDGVIVHEQIISR